MAVVADASRTAESAALAGMSAEELAQRVAVLRRFRTLLQQQRDRFRSYLEVLDKQQDIIATGSAEELLSHVELEEKIVADIFSIQKVIDPLETMYQAVFPGARGFQRSEGADDVPDLKAALEDLKKKRCSVPPGTRNCFPGAWWNSAPRSRRSGKTPTPPMPGAPPSPAALPLPWWMLKAED